MNCTIHFFGREAVGNDSRFYQFPNDYAADIFCRFENRFKGDVLLALHRNGNLTYHIYFQRFENGYLGLCASFNSVWINNTGALLNVFDQTMANIVNRGIFAMFDDNGKMLSKASNIATKQIEAQEVCDQLSRSFGSFDCWSRCLPPVNVSIESNALKCLSNKASDEDWRIAMENYCSIYSGYSNYDIRGQYYSLLEKLKFHSSRKRTANSVGNKSSLSLSKIDWGDVLGAFFASLFFISLLVGYLFAVRFYGPNIQDYIIEDVIQINPKTKFVYTGRGKFVKFKMKLVEGGSFMMGATDRDHEAKVWEKPAHNVSLKSYYIAEAEVSQKLWMAVMDNNPSKSIGKKLPVNCVSWDDCVEFCNRLSLKTGKRFRLPTEAEWEFAARGGKKSRNYLYSGSDELEKVAWVVANSDDLIHPIKRKKPNELGLYDMTGNVWEMCNDWFVWYSSEDEINPTGPDFSEKGKVRRGGAWHSSPTYCRTTFRYYDQCDQGYEYLGFRIVMELPVSEEKDVWWKVYGKKLGFDF